MKVRNLLNSQFSQEIKNSTGSLNILINHDTGLIEARSYGHWMFARNFKDVIVVNGSFYSNSTAKHQIFVKQLISNRKALVINETTESLHDVESALLGELIGLLDKKAELKRLISSPRSHKSANIKRAREVMEIDAKSKAIVQLLAKQEV